MKHFSLTIFLCLSVIVLKSQNIDSNRENDKKKKEDQKIIQKEDLNEVGKMPDKVIQSKENTHLDFIEMSEEANQTTETIVIVTKKKNKRSKDKMLPPAQKFRVRLLIQNKNLHPMWYLMPYNGANRLPVNGLFNAEPSLIDGQKMLSMRLYQGEIPETFLREMLFTGIQNQHFRAFYLPAGATLKLKNFNIDCWQDSETVEFWAVKELKANNSTALQDILPYEAISSINIEINCPLDQNCSTILVAPDKDKSISTEPLRFVKADKVSKYQVRLNQPH